MNKHDTNNIKIKSFTNLIAWQKAHVLVLETYKFTGNFPKEEIYVLTSQLRRCAISISSNIAEGFSRKTKKDKVQFYTTSLGSLTEHQNQLLISRDLKYISTEKFQLIAERTIELSKLINGLIKSAETKKENT